MPVVVAIIILLAWAVILGPSLVKRRSRLSDGVHSISHFHEQLKVLEHSAPEPIVTPAYRLHTVDRRGRTSGIHVPGRRHPAGALGGRCQAAPPSGAGLPRRSRHPSRGGMLRYAVPSARALRPGSGTRRSRCRGQDRARRRPPRLPDLYARQTARRRRRDTLAVLCGWCWSASLIGFLPGAGSAWIVTGLSRIAMAVYVTLLVRLRQQAEGARAQAAVPQPADGLGPADGIDPADPEAPVRAIARGPANPARAMAERYAHPSSGGRLPTDPGRRLGRMPHGA